MEIFGYLESQFEDDLGENLILQVDININIDGINNFDLNDFRKFTYNP